MSIFLIISFLQIWDTCFFILSTFCNNFAINILAIACGKRNAKPHLGHIPKNLKEHKRK